MRRSLPYLVALVLGAGAALLAACGSGGPKGGVPANAGSDLKSQLENVRGTVDSAHCDRLAGELRRVIDRIDALPSSVDPQLSQRLSDGYGSLRTQALKECNANRDAQRTTTTDTQTDTTTTDTQTTTQPPATITTAPQTTTVPPTTTTPVPPPVTPPPAPPPPPGGGTPPQVSP